MRLPVRVAGPLAFRPDAGVAIRSGASASAGAPGGGSRPGAAGDHPDRGGRRRRRPRRLPSPSATRARSPASATSADQRAASSRQVIGAENVAEQTDFTDHNLLYLDGGYDRGLKPGDEFWIVTPGDEVVHPVTGESMGRFYQYRGRAVVLCIEGRTAIVRVTLACTDIPLGSFLKAYEPIPIPLGPPSAGRGGLRSPQRKGARAASSTPATASSPSATDTDVLVDLGVAEGRPARRQFCDLPLRRPGGLRHPPAGLLLGQRSAAGGRRGPAHLPRRSRDPLRRRPLGRRPRVIDSDRLIEVGDQVELK